jgi:hypothetical protein
MTKSVHDPGADPVTEIVRYPYSAITADAVATPLQPTNERFVPALLPPVTAVAVATNPFPAATVTLPRGT